MIYYFCAFKFVICKQLSLGKWKWGFQWSVPLMFPRFVSGQQGFNDSYIFRAISFFSSFLSRFFPVWQFELVNWISVGFGYPFFTFPFFHLFCSFYLYPEMWENLIFYHNTFIYLMVAFSTGKWTLHMRHVALVAISGTIILVLYPGIFDKSLLRMIGCQDDCPSNQHQVTCPVVLFLIVFCEIFLQLPVFEIAWWTGARDQQKQHRSSKTTVFAGPKDQQLVLYFGNSHCPNIVPNTWNTFQSSKTVWWFKFSVVFHVALPLEIMIKSFWLLTYFFGPPQLIPDHQR